MNNKSEYNRIKLFELLSSRMLHDIASSASIIDICFSISNEGKNTIKANELLQEEIQKMRYKINFFRNAYAAYEQDSMKVSCFNKILHDFFDCTRVKLNLNFAKGITEINFTVAKISLILLIIAAEAVNFHGTIDIFINNPTGKKIIEVIVNKTKFTNKFKQEADNCLTIGNCYEYYINNLCTENAYRINVENEAPELLKYFLEKVSL